MERHDGHPAIELHQVRKTFGRQVVLNGLDLRVDRGEAVAVLGRSGTGKSILLKLIVGLQKPDSGAIVVHGSDVTRVPADELNAVRTKVGFLFQEAALYDSLSLEDNVAFPLQRHQRLSTSDLNARVRDLLAGVGLDRDVHKIPAEISGGMKKRVGLARALALDPDIVLFDEPTAGLDPITAAEIEELILKMRKSRKVASIVVTHDLRGARTVADRLAFMHEGQIVADGTFDELTRSPHPVVSRFFEEGG